MARRVALVTCRALPEGDPDRRDAFVAWARSVPRLVNPADVLDWNTDKRYLARGSTSSPGRTARPCSWRPS